MIIEPLGDAAIILRSLEVPAYELAEAIQSSNLPGVFEAVASYETVAIYFDPAVFDARSLDQIQLNGLYAKSTLHEIPVSYELGEDLGDIAKALGLLADEVVRLHSSQAYRCFAVGFCPGFPYLGYLPPALSGMPRRPAPRVRIEPGSVAITGRQTGIYPMERPGGWAILGRTPLCLVDAKDAYFPIKAGDEVRFYPIEPDEFIALKGERL
jgi:inhibitor of KinA